MELETRLREEGSSARNLVSWRVPHSPTASKADTLDTSRYPDNQSSKRQQQQQHKSGCQRSPIKRSRGAAGRGRGDGEPLASKSPRSVREHPEQTDKALERVWGILFRNVSQGFTWMCGRDGKSFVTYAECHPYSDTPSLPLPTSVDDDAHSHPPPPSPPPHTRTRAPPRQAVDELYYFCEAQSSLERCGDAAELLASCHRDFAKLVARLQDQLTFERSPTKAAGVAWEVRTTTAAAPAPPPAPGDVSLLHAAMARMGVPRDSKWLRHPPHLVPDAAQQQQRRQQQQQQRQQAARPRSASASSAASAQPAAAAAAAATGRSHARSGSGSSGGGGGSSSGTASKAAMRGQQQPPRGTPPLGAQSSPASKAAALHLSPAVSRQRAAELQARRTRATATGADATASGSGSHAQQELGQSREPVQPPHKGTAVTDTEASPAAAAAPAAAAVAPPPGDGQATQPVTPRMQSPDSGALSTSVPATSVPAALQTPTVPVAAEVSDAPAMPAAPAWVDAEAQAEEEAWRELVTRGAAARGESPPCELQLLEEDPEQQLAGAAAVGNDATETDQQPVELIRQSAQQRLSSAPALALGGFGGLHGARGRAAEGTGGLGDAGGEGGRSGSHHELHRKLLSTVSSHLLSAVHVVCARSPERKRPSPAEAKQKHDQRQHAAQQNREQLASGLQEKARARSDHARRVKTRQDQRLAEAQEVIRRRMDDAGARREAHISSVVRKANDENCKVYEVSTAHRSVEVAIEVEYHNIFQSAASGARPTTRTARSTSVVRKANDENGKVYEVSATHRSVEVDVGVAYHHHLPVSSVVRKANNENCKVYKVLFMNKLTVEDLKITLQMRLHEVERRIMGGRMRRQHHLVGIAARQVVTLLLCLMMCEVERRIMGGRMRRQHHLIGIAARQRTRAREMALSMTERQSEMDKAAAERWQRLQDTQAAGAQVRKCPIRQRERCPSRRAFDARRQCPREYPAWIRRRRWGMLARLESVHRRREERMAEVQRRSETAERAQREAKDRRNAMLQERRVACFKHARARARQREAEKCCNAMLQEVIAKVAAKERRREESGGGGGGAAPAAGSSGGSSSARTRRAAGESSSSPAKRAASPAAAAAPPEGGDGGSGGGDAGSGAAAEGAEGAGGGGGPSKGAKKRARRARGHLRRCAGGAWDEAWAGKDAAAALRCEWQRSALVCCVDGTDAKAALISWSKGCASGDAGACMRKVVCVTSRRRSECAAGPCMCLGSYDVRLRTSKVCSNHETCFGRCLRRNRYSSPPRGVRTPHTAQHLYATRCRSRRASGAPLAARMRAAALIPGQCALLLLTHVDGFSATSLRARAAAVSPGQPSSPPLTHVGGLFCSHAQASATRRASAWSARRRSWRRAGRRRRCATCCARCRAAAAPLPDHDLMRSRSPTAAPPSAPCPPRILPPPRSAAAAASKRADAELHLARTSRVLEHLHALCVPPRATPDASSAAAAAAAAGGHRGGTATLALRCLVAALRLPANRHHALRACGGGAHLADRLAWALSQRCAAAAAAPSAAAAKAAKGGARAGGSAAGATAPSCLDELFGADAAQQLEPCAACLVLLLHHDAAASRGAAAAPAASAAAAVEAAAPAPAVVPHAAAGSGLDDGAAAAGAQTAAASGSSGSAAGATAAAAAPSHDDGGATAAAGNAAAVVAAQAALARYALARGAVAALCAALAALHARSAALAGDASGLATVARLMELLDAMATFAVQCNCWSRAPGLRLRATRRRNAPVLTAFDGNATASASGLDTCVLSHSICCAFAVWRRPQGTGAISDDALTGGPPPPQPPVPLEQAVVAGLKLPPMVTLLMALLMGSERGSATHAAAAAAADDGGGGSGTASSRGVLLVMLPTLHCISSLAQLNLGAVQDALASQAARTEFLALSDRLLAALAAATAADGGCSELEGACLRGLLVVLGQFALCCPRNQDMLLWGAPPTPLVRLCRLPYSTGALTVTVGAPRTRRLASTVIASQRQRSTPVHTLHNTGNRCARLPLVPRSYFSEEDKRRALLPTLVAAAFRHERARVVIGVEVSTRLLRDCVSAAISDAAPGAPARARLAPRFPPHLWNEAVEFFS
ncbi:hypothetical protein JKP88DRAFT_253841 [Tribonema minus]|uniref:S phase cyclin A-associated protein in the endoplasmic reticulum N-terminal domain-containing protein n=1 Tax=Tribonema minus TaxID=303371 RepID=A0A835ZAD3_9STRA|nr:hypothetical protein JKP88DRAFT_253841 [Tribonema minus]